MVSDNQAGAGKTHIEDDEDPIELRFPGGNGLFVIPGVKKSRDCIVSAPFDDLILYFRDGPIIESMVVRRIRNYNHYIADPTHTVN